MMESIYLRFFFLFLPFHSRQSKARSYSYQCRGRDGGVCVGGDDSWDSIIVVFCRSGVTVSFSNCRWNNHSSGSRNHVDSFGSSFCIECSAEQSTRVSNSSTTNNDTNTTRIYNASSASTTSSRSSRASSNTHTPTNTYTNTNQTKPKPKPTPDVFWATDEPFPADARGPADDGWVLPRERRSAREPRADERDIQAGRGRWDVVCACSCFCFFLYLYFAPWGGYGEAE